MKREVALIAALAVLGGLRVWLLASALPFFNPTDEHQHVDSVLRYSRGELPDAEGVSLDTRTAWLALRWGSFEYLDAGPEVRPPYLRAEGATATSPAVQRAFDAFLGVANTEFESPPVYYALAAGWLRLGSLLGLEELGLLYWVRWLNALLLAALVFGSHRVLRSLYPADPFVRVGVPALLAFFPQDCLLGVTADALSPAVGGLAFGLAVLATLASEDPRRPRSRHLLVAAGGAAALAFLTKYTNLVYLALGLLVGGRWLSGEPGTRRARAEAVSGYWLAALVPVALWLGHNWLVLGDALGTARKVAHLEWTQRPASEWLAHPLFSIEGAIRYPLELFALFWRGELVWYGEPLAWAALDGLYGAGSMLLVAAAALGWLRHRRAGAARSPASCAEALALCAVAGGVGCLALLSVRFEFADWGTPTRDAPFFVHGRLIAGVLLPFCLLWVRGLQVACSPLPDRASRWAPPSLLIAWIAGVTVAESALVAPVFASPWNWYNLP